MNQLQQKRAREAARAKFGKESYIDYKGATIYIHKYGRSKTKEQWYKGTYSWTPTSGRINVYIGADRQRVLEKCKTAVDEQVSFHIIRDEFLYKREQN